MIKLNDAPLTTPFYTDTRAALGNSVCYKIELLLSDGTSRILSDLLTVHLTPEELTLDGVYPNPFNSSTKVSFTLPIAANVVLGLFDLQGRELYRQPLGRVEAGSHQATLQTSGVGLTAGTYFLRLGTDQGSKVMKVVLLR